MKRQKEETLEETQRNRDRGGETKGERQRARDGGEVQ
jgi:hypothetical protein